MRYLGAMDMSMVLPKQSLTTQMWEEQVEKAFLGLSPDWILKMAKGVHMEDTSSRNRGPRRISTGNWSIRPRILVTWMSSV